MATSLSADATVNLRVPLRGVELNVRTAGEGPATLLLHGFTGSSATWDSHVAPFERRMKTIAVDLIGHGDSDTPADPENYRMESCIEHLLVILDELGLESVNLVGYSMGGRVALHLATAAPDRVRSMILESSSPGIADPIERQKRVAADNLLADYIERKGVDAFVDRWESLPLFESQRNLPVGCARCPQRPKASEQSRLAWRIACAVWAPAGRNRSGTDYLLSKRLSFSSPASSMLSTAG